MLRYGKALKETSVPGSQQVWPIDDDAVPEWVREFNGTHLGGVATHVTFHAAKFWLSDDNGDVVQMLDAQ